MKTMNSFGVMIAVLGMLAVCAVSVSGQQPFPLMRQDGRCGKNFRLPDGEPGQCDPLASDLRKGPCCSDGGYCGHTVNHCNCQSCIDYRKPEHLIYKRSDGRCGANFKFIDGEAGRCDPTKSALKKGPCCSSGGYCGHTANHCICPTCVDYRKPELLKYLRSDGKCGSSFEYINGEGARCDPFASEVKKGPCCSKWGNCGNTVNHCDCSACVDFREPATTTTTTTMTNTSPDATARTPTGSFLDTTVECNSQGFKPLFTYHVPTNELHNIAINIDIGGLGQSDCVSSMPTENTTGLARFNHSDFSSNYSDHIPYMETTTQPRCGGLFQHWTESNKEVIKYEVNVTAVVTRTFRRKIHRKTQYPFIIKCLLERELNVSTNNSFRVLEELVDAADVDRATDRFTFDASIKFYDSNYTDEKTERIVRPRNDEKLYLEVKQEDNQALFKFVVNKCYATSGPRAMTNAHEDVFFEGQCPVDETVRFQRTQDGEFQFSILSFSFPNRVNTIYFHCDILVCLAGNSSTPCTQKEPSECPSSRRRRSIEDVDYDHEKTITAAQPVLLQASQVDTPWCGEGFLYDRELKTCSRKNILEVRNIRLSRDIWRPEYADTSSLAFKELAKIKEYQLWVLVETTRQNNIIHGVKVLRARPGSIILDVAIKYSDSVSDEQAFTTFKQLLYTPASTTRVQNILRISHEEAVQYIPVIHSEKTDTERLILIVVVVAVFVVIFIAGVTLFKIRQLRQRSTTGMAVGFDNKGVDN